MATANDIVSRALRLLGIIASGEAIEASIGADSLTSLNNLGQRMLASGALAAWTDATTLSDALVTPASANDALAYLLAVRIAPEYVGGAPEPIAQQASAELTLLWRDRLAATTTAGTAEDVILRALRIVGSAGNLPDTVSFPQALGTLNALQAEMHEAGIGLPDYSVAALATPLTSDIGDREAIAYQLALRLAPEYGVSLAPEALSAAQTAMFRLRSRYHAVSPPIPSTYY